MLLEEKKTLRLAVLWYEIFFNVFNININSMKVGKKKMSEKCGIWLASAMQKSSSCSKKKNE